MKNGYFEFLTHFIDLTDPREERGRNHLLIDLVGMTLCGTICGANTWADIERFAVAHEAWFAEFLELPNGIPSHDTFGRVFRILDTEQFQKCLASWVDHLQLKLEGTTVALDGKTVKGSHDKTCDQKPLHVVSAWANQLSFCLGQISVESKSNEIPAVQELLEILNLKGAVVTGDAMHCQTKTVQAITEKQADYLLQVKGNQKTLLKSIVSEFDHYAEDDFSDRRVRQQTVKEKNRGREETRTCVVAPAPAALKSKWSGLKTIGLINRTRKLADGTEQREQSYFISSLEPRVRVIAKHLRNHWGVENGLHYTLDVTFGEDHSRIRKGNGPEIISVFRRLALSILKQDTTVKDNVRGKRMIAGWDLTKLEGILLAFQAA